MDGYDDQISGDFASDPDKKKLLKLDPERPITQYPEKLVDDPNFVPTPASLFEPILIRHQNETRPEWSSETIPFAPARSGMQMRNGILLFESRKIRHLERMIDLFHTLFEQK